MHAFILPVLTYTMTKYKQKNVTRNSKHGGNLPYTGSGKIKKKQTKSPFNKMKTKQPHNTHSGPHSQVNKKLNVQTHKTRPKITKVNNNSKSDRVKWSKKSKKTADEDNDSDFEVIKSGGMEYKVSKD